MDLKEKLDSIGEVMREAYKRRWISMRDGNISVRDGNDFYITPSGVRKYTIYRKDLIKNPKKDGKASIETHMHFLIHEDKGADKAVVHLHPTNVVAAMHAGFDLEKLAKAFPELHRYTKVGPVVHVAAPGSAVLAEDTALALKLSDVVGQLDHGVTAVGNDPWDAFEHIERLDHICEIALKAYAVQPPVAIEHKVVLDATEEV